MDIESIEDVKFVKAWQSAMTKAEAAASLGLTSDQVGRIADRLRRAGVDLKRFPRGRPKKDVKVFELNKLIQRLKDS